MDVSQLKDELAKRMPSERFNHVLRVNETALLLADQYSVPKEHAEQAALFHDIAKYRDKDSLRLMIIQEKIDSRLLSFHHELWHAPVGAVNARDEFGVTNEDVLNAIRYHTTGRAGMSRLEKVIYVADMIEPGREFLTVDRLRELALEDIDLAMGACIHQSMQYLVSKRVSVFPDSLDCYNEHVTMRGIVK